ncbi:MAG: hypothetical protein QNI95_06625 [Desulfobacterales bacterium]|nr:hypothetical protein [Desulfobacterales bacterium]
MATMAFEPEVRFFLYDIRRPLVPDGKFWNQPLPLNRRMASAEVSARSSENISYGHYFQAVQNLLIQDNGKHLANAARRCLARTILPESIDRLDIILKKHGAYYHPAKIGINADDQQFWFVCNVALSETGYQTLAREYRLIKSLLAHKQSALLPQVYTLCQDICLDGGLKASAFIGEWLDDFHEFHTVRNQAGQKHVEVWDSGRGRYVLSLEETKSLYRQVAFIHTSYYDLNTSRHIYPWHHAAGDFVLRRRPNQIDVRLITVRNYLPFVSTPPDDIADILEALTLFCLHLTLHTRLDRIRGTGEIVWADNEVVSPTLAGFFEGLACLQMPVALPVSLAEGFHDYLAALSEATLTDLASDIVAKYPDNAPEIDIINNELERHVATVYEAIQQM